MLLIQLGWQVIYKINTLTATYLADEMPLGNAQGADYKLLLAPRENVSGIMRTQSQTQIGTLGARLGMPHLLVSNQRSGEYLAQFAILVPAAVVAQGQAIQLDQFLEDALKNRLQGHDVIASVFIYFRARQGQFPVPGSLRNCVKCTMPQPRVSLSQRLLQALPGGHEPRFHVEHSPIEKLPSNLGSTLEKPETVRIDQLKRENFCKLRGAAGILAVDTDGEFTMAFTRNT